jgi:hypothetical protein
MNTFGYWLIALSIPFNAGVIDINTMGFFAAHGGGMLFIVLMGFSALCSAILVVYSFITIILFVIEKEKEDYLPIIIFPFFLIVQIFVWFKYFLAY